MNRITKSSVVKVISVDTGDMDKTKVRPYLQQLRQHIETKVAIDVGNNMTEGSTYGPVENMIFLPQHEGKNAISVTDIGSQEVNPQLGDVDYFRKKLFSALGIPGAYLGEDDGESGFDSGTNLTLKSAQFAKKIKRLQNALIQAITDEINLILLDKGLMSYINEFTIKMQPPTTQEERDRKENMASTISGIDSQMRLLSDYGVEDPIAKLNILKILLSDAGLNPDIITIIQDQIDKLEQGAQQASGEGESSGGSGDLNMDFDFSDEGEGDMDLGGDLGGETEAEPVDLGGDLGGEEEAPIEGGAEEGFQQSRGQKVLNERENLPT